jgi:hypothetical protein
LNIDSYIADLERRIVQSLLISSYTITIDGYNVRQDADVLFRHDNSPDPKARTLASFPRHKHTKSVTTQDPKNHMLARKHEAHKELQKMNLIIGSKPGIKAFLRAFVALCEKQT